MSKGVDKNLFLYLTKRAGLDLTKVAKLWGLSSVVSVYKRLNGEVELRRDEMESWMAAVGVGDAGPIFFPAFVADTQPAATPGVGAADGG